VGSGCVSYYSFKQLIADADFNLKVDKQIGDLNGQIYIGHTLKEEAAVGSRISWDFNNLELGVAALWLDYQDEEQQLTNYEFDLQYTLPKYINVKTQIGNIDDGNNDTDDLNFFCLIQKDEPFYIPFVKEIIPYAGISTRDEMKENSVIMGLNFSPVTDAYIKIEHVLDSSEDVDPRSDIQVGYTF